MIALVDCNSFFCSCEQVFRPDLQHRPVVVLSNNDGCVIARNQLAKNCGIPMGAVYYQYQSMMEQNDVAVFSSNFPLYADFSSRVMNILRTFSPLVEVYSIDEAFIQLDGLVMDEGVVSYCRFIRSTILKYTGIPVSIGIASSKVLAKCANKFAKSLSVQGVFYLNHEKVIDSALKQFDVSGIWGIGARQIKKCHKLKIFSAYDFKVYKNRARLLSLFTKLGCQIQDELCGRSCLPVNDVIGKRKSIRYSRSFKPELTDFEDVFSALSVFVSRAMEKCRVQKLCCQTITVFLRTNFFNKEQSQYRNSLTTGLLTATNDTLYCVNVVRHVLMRIFKSGYSYKKAGIILSDFCDDQYQQLSFFDCRVNQSLMSVMDYINQQYGQDMLQVATNKRYLKKRRVSTCVSPRYTTKWNEILTVLN